MKLDKEALKEYDEFLEECIKGTAQLTDSEFRQIIIDIMLGKDWYVADSVSQYQCNEAAMEDILYMLTKTTHEQRWNKYCIAFTEDKLKQTKKELKELKKK